MLHLITLLVSTARQQFFGGSAAQSPLIPFLDVCLGIDHESQKSKVFLLQMREYMLESHRNFLVYIESISNIRSYILQTTDVSLKSVYNECVDLMKKFRVKHMSLVADYIIAQQQRESPADSGKKSQRLHKSAGGKGTGGTDLLNFLKPIVRDCTNKRLKNFKDENPGTVNSEFDSKSNELHSSKRASRGLESFNDSINEDYRSSSSDSFAFSTLKERDFSVTLSTFNDDDEYIKSEGSKYLNFKCHFYHH